MTATLTERYIAAAVRSIQPASRDDVQTELEVSIADAIEARTSKGEEGVDAERAVLSDLGDPRVLAAGYADRPMQLIGPRYYLTWWFLLKLLWAIVPLVAMVGVALSQVLAEASLGDIIGSSISTGLGAVVTVAFWVTLVFAVLERTVTTSVLPDWDVDRLPDIRPSGAGRADMIAALVFLVLGVGALLWDRFRGFVLHDGQALPLLSPELWPWWITGLMVLMAAQTALVITVYITGRWTPASAVLNTVLALVLAITATTLLANGQLVNPEFVTLAFAENGVNADTLRTLAIITGAGTIGFPIWAIIDGWQKTFRDNRR